jgi:hypothetical protein
MVRRGAGDLRNWGMKRLRGTIRRSAAWFTSRRKLQKFGRESVTGAGGLLQCRGMHGMPPMHKRSDPGVDLPGRRWLKLPCVGGDSNVPLGFVSVTENLMMVGMAIWMILKPAGLGHG